MSEADLADDGRWPGIPDLPDAAGREHPVRAYVWGVKWQVLYPGMKLVPNSADAGRWSHELGLPFYEATIETNGHDLCLVFSDLIVDPVDPGYAPFVVPEGGPDGKFPIL